MSLVKKQWEFVRDIAKLITFAEKHGIMLTFGEAFRTQDQQKLNYYGYEVQLNDQEIGFKKKEPTSWTLQSQHLKRLAVDFNFFVKGKLTYKKEDVQLLGDYWESLNPKNRWGGNWLTPDTPHFERLD